MKHNILDDYEYFANNGHDLAEKLSRIEKECKRKAKREHRHGHYLEGDAHIRGAVIAVRSNGRKTYNNIHSKDKLNREAAP